MSRKQAHRPDGVPGEDSTRLDILLEDYSNCRDDDRNWWMIVATLLAISITLVGALFAAVTQTCQFSTSVSCSRVPDYVVAGAPLLPIGVIAVTLMLGTLSTVRTFYMRAIEQEIRQYAGGPLKLIPGLEPASYVDFSLEITSLRRGRTIYRLLSGVLVLTVLLVFGGLAAYIAIHLNIVAQTLMALLYGPLIVILAYESYASGAGGRSVFSAAVKEYLAHRNDPRYVLRIEEAPPLRDAERNLVSYLLFPRPADWVKLLIAPGAFLVASWSIGAFGNWRDFIIIWFILEYLIYAARYQWNDIRGINEDPHHPGKAERKRLPCGGNVKRSIVISAFVAFLRIALALVIAAVARLSFPVGILTILVLGVATIYEFFRTESARWATIGLRQARIFGIWTVAGLGYAIRSGAGVWAAGYTISSFQEVSTAIFFVVYGAMFVLLSWALESASYCESNGSDALFPKSESNTKTHVYVLLKWCGWTLKNGAGLVQGKTLPILKGKRGNIYAPWNISMFLSALAGTVVGFGLLGPQLRMGEFIAGLIISGAGAFILTVLLDFRWRLGVTVLVCAAIIGIALSGDFEVKAIIAELPWAATAGLYSFFRESSYDDMMNFGPNSARVLGDLSCRMMLSFFRIIIGRQTWQSVGFNPDSRKEGGRGGATEDWFG